MAKKNFYAVKQGRQIGIFQTWAECKAQTDGYAGAIFKGFTTYYEAEKWFNADQEPVTISYKIPECKTVDVSHIKLPPEWKLDINPEEDAAPWD